MSTSPHAPKILAHCPLCQTPYGEHAVRLLGEKGPMNGHPSSQTFHLTCRSCRHSVLAVILESHHGVSSVGLVTDLEVQDAVRMHDAPSLTANDCVAFHEVLERQSRELCERLMLK